MFSFSLFKQSVKSNWILWTVLTLVMAILLIQFASLEMTKSLLFVIFYGMMAMIFPGIYVLISSNKLLASQVDKGSMAYILSTPKKRSTIVITQAIFSIVSIIAMFVVATVAHIIVNNIEPLDLAICGFPSVGGNLTTAMILKLNLSAMAVSIGMGGICFMFSGIFNLSKYSIGASGTFVGVMILANMLTMFGSLGVSALNNFKYITICTLYNFKDILLNGNTWIGQMGIALAIGIVGYLIGGITFCKKDLPM